MVNYFSEPQRENRLIQVDHYGSRCTMLGVGCRSKGALRGFGQFFELTKENITKAEGKRLPGPPKACGLRQPTLNAVPTRQGFKSLILVYGL
jgi:hypothetical protein